MLYSVESILKNTRVGEDKKNGDEEEEEEEEEDEEEEVENKNKRNRMYCFLFLSIKADIIPRSHTKFPFFFFLRCLGLITYPEIVLDLLCVLN